MLREDFVFILRQLQRFGLSSVDAEDVAQEVLHGAYRALPRYDRSRGRLRTWLYRIAFNQAHTFMNRARHHREVLVAGIDLEPLVDPAPNAEQQLISEETRVLALQLIEMIEPHLRAVFVEYELEGKSMLEIAEILNIPMSTGWGQLQQARRQFTEALKRWRLRHRERVMRLVL
jgi:RNA polymerase sigma-70 factor (ECF subfamily)